MALKMGLHYGVLNHGFSVSKQWYAFRVFVEITTCGESLLYEKPPLNPTFSVKCKKTSKKTPQTG